MRHTERGVTLLEVLVALVISGTILVALRAVVEQLGDTADRITAAATAADRIANSERIAHDLAIRTVAGSADTPFTGWPHMARFTSWCDMPSGWREQCTVTIEAAPPAHGVILRTSTGDTVTLLADAIRPSMHYLGDPADGTRWRMYWPSEAGTPFAIGVGGERDTLVLRIGARQ